MGGSIKPPKIECLIIVVFLNLYIVLPHVQNVKNRKLLNGEFDAEQKERLEKIDAVRIINVTNCKFVAGDREELLSWFKLEREVVD